MQAAEALIERLQLQIEAAPNFEIHEDLPGFGSDFDRWQQSVIDVVIEQMNVSKGIESLKTIAGGPRKYAAVMQKVLNALQPVAGILQECARTKGARYEDGEARQKAMGRIKDKPAQVIAACKTGITELQEALKLLDEAESRDTVKAGAK